ncbi:hypothetical protein FGO68_gene3245 [Halteria grandinella]|uniref:Uncharacterized protein n=1 Tax=Halteria grandinella TaxID=5974 RepID=A0A8J8P502_HALGN|nr:hypothetical protein FGO68_gene3245 [Halteria grandinella]
MRCLLILLHLIRSFLFELLYLFLEVLEQIIIIHQNIQLLFEYVPLSFEITTPLQSCQFIQLHQAVVLADLGCLRFGIWVCLICCKLCIFTLFARICRLCKRSILLKCHTHPHVTPIY